MGESSRGRATYSDGVADRCPFCAIVAGEATGHMVLDEPAVAAFLDVRPVFPGHTLVVPRTHSPDLASLDPTTLAELFGAARRVALAVEGPFGSDGAFVAVNDRVSQSVPHIHVHVVPRRFKDGLRGFFWPRQRYADDDEPARIAATLRKAIAGQAEG